VIPASPVRQAQQVRWAQPVQQAPKDPLGLLEIPHKGEAASIGGLADVLESVGDNPSLRRLHAAGLYFGFVKMSRL
jgi:hypothetical protein